jgi:hypothetical protein
MAGGAEYAVTRQQPGVERLHNRRQFIEIAFQQRCLLFCKWRMAAKAVSCICIVIIYDLTEQAWRECLGMPAG